MSAPTPAPAIPHPPFFTAADLGEHLERLGVGPGMTLMLHASLRSMGWVVGGADQVLQALLDRLGPKGTLMMYAGWEDNPYHLEQWDADRRNAYLVGCPPFEPKRSRARRDHGVLAESLRTWPGACRSDHPEASMVAVGAQARQLTRHHPHDFPFGPGSPLDRLVHAEGHVLLLGSHLAHVTLLHLAENLARLPHKRQARYTMPVLRHGQPVWETFVDFDTSQGIVDRPGEDYFETITRAYLETGAARSGLIGCARSHLLDARGLLNFAVHWMEFHLIPSPPSSTQIARPGKVVGG